MVSKLSIFIMMVNYLIIISKIGVNYSGGSGCKYGLTYYEVGVCDYYYCFSLTEHNNKNVYLSECNEYYINKRDFWGY
ncbi:hypothetical protein XCR1_810034 [Xenorhabdus cabanillasii JM26]|uniref:Uncharacterized protein n=1 Tax=Xenorhabdus cabanillasii JM26 TaxID=1427517 RepID=W1JAT2_9GAMM|nr:hypothetical protein Xcab_02779 [Xenorhabdus cabanillasii JM26]CDL86981.1 hypothetical protein XCR1_810034 [Xenorhabdus cabanillasii JM26]